MRGGGFLSPRGGRAPGPAPERPDEGAGLAVAQRERDVTDRQAGVLQELPGDLGPDGLLHLVVGGPAIRDPAIADAVGFIAATSMNRAGNLMDP